MRVNKSWKLDPILRKLANKTSSFCNIAKRIVFRLRSSKLLRKIERKFSQNRRRFGASKRYLFVDVTYVMGCDYKTGVQRVVRAITLELLKLKLQKLTIKPVYLSDSGCRWHYRYANSWTNQLIGKVDQRFNNKEIQTNPGDVLLIADLTLTTMVEAQRHGLYEELRTAGVDIAGIVYDILPLQLPTYFPAIAAKNHRDWLIAMATISSQFLCISKAVAEETKAWLWEHQPKSLESLKVDWFHLGADIEQSQPSLGLPDNLEVLKSQLTGHCNFLMVGTVEPRKGHRQVVAAFDQLLEEGHPFNLVIVGKEGWMMEDLAMHMQHSKHREQGLFWFSAASDEFLAWLYQHCQCLIGASEGEGFGLPLIEAAMNKMPLLIRDIPVFKEVAGEGAAYFSSTEPERLATAIKSWEKLFKLGHHPDSSRVKWITWKDSAQQLLIKMNPYFTNKKL
tara:strand:+ start:100 stop:1449 length:1350 start_codon:yes stop_codon:yes gene_type:complete